MKIAKFWLVSKLSLDTQLGAEPQFRHEKRQLLQIILLFGMVVGLTGCGAATQPAANQPAQDTTLKVALLPILDVLPFYVAEEKGYFAEAGLQVEGVNVDSARNRDAMMQAGEVEGMLTDLQSVAFFNRETPSVEVVLKARKAYAEFPHFRIVAGPGVTINEPADLAGVPVGISQNTVIEYLNDRLLTAWGLSEADIAVEQVPAIPTRFEMLMNGQLPAALLPDPLAQAAIAAGGSLIVDDSQFPDYSQSVLAFSKETIASKPDTVEAFLEAWNKAVADINQEPNLYREVLIDKTRVPPSVQGTYNVPQFPAQEITTEAEWQDVIAWMQAKGLLDEPVAYVDSVNRQFVE